LDALDRIEDLIGEVSEHIPRRQIGATINLIVEIRRAPESKAGRQVKRLVRVRGYEEGKYITE
jgi:Flp pilus assembly CpaF family ATPase